MTTREQDGADSMIREIEARKAHWYRVGVFAAVMSAGAVSLYLLIEGVARLAHWLGGAL